MVNGKNNGLQLIESLENGEQKIYNSVFVETKHIDILSNDLAVKIVSWLAANKGCAMDLSRELKQHEQKIYYHLRRLEQAGIIKKVGTERRFGMTAKMYSAVSPIVSTKLYEDGHTINQKSNPKMRNLSPFIDKGKLNAKIVLGAPFPHGEHGATARDGVYMADLALFLGTFLTNTEDLSCKLDTEIRESDYNNNLILIGGPKINTIVAKINSKLPIYFDEKNEWTLISRKTGEAYGYDAHAVIIKMKSPFNSEKDILLLAGRRSVGLRSAILAFINHYNKIMATEKSGVVTVVVNGIDKDSDGIVDSVEFVEE